MKRLVLLVVTLAVAAGLAHSGTPVWVTPDVPTDESLNGTTLLPWEIYRYDGTGYFLQLSVPGNPDINAIHRLDEPGDWLFSVDAPTDLAGLLLPVGSIAEPRDLIRYDGATGTYRLCFVGAASGLGPGTNIDAVAMEGGDPTCAVGTGGRLLLGFDAPTDVFPFIGPSAFEPADLARFAPLGVGPCPGWTIAAANPAFDASAAGSGIALSSITTGADRIIDTAGFVETILALDVPSDVGPPAATYSPGQLLETDTASFSLFEPLGGWPISSIVDGVSCAGNPGRVPIDILLDKAGGLNLQILWSPSCSQGADDYGIHEGTIGSWYSHTAIDCSDGGPPLQEVISPGVGDRYYLVVPHNGCGAEGSYGRCSPGVCFAANERPPGASTCAPHQVLTCCP